MLLRQLERALHGELPLLYRALNEVLIGAGILPEFKRSYRHATAVGSAAADAGNILDTLQRLARARLPGLAAGAGSGSAALAGGMGADVSGTLGAAIPIPISTPAGSAGAGTAAPMLPPGTIAVSADFLAALQALQRATPEDGTGAGMEPEPLTNVVRLARASEAAQQAAPLDTITMDIVATLFDLIFDDGKVPEAVKGLVSRLQIPVLKVALLDQKFFADRGHPARRFLDSISGIAIRWGGTIDTGDPFYGKLSELVERIQNNFDQDVAVFGTAVAELSAFVNECEALEEETSNSVVEAVQRREAAQQRRLAREAAASQAAEQVLAQAITKKTPLPIEQFLRGQWRAVLEHIGAADGADGGIDSPSFQAAERVAEELAWSVTPKRSTEDRQRFTALLPQLLPALHQGLDRIGIGADARKPLFDALITLHAAALHADRRALRKAPALEAEAAANEAPMDAASVTLQVTHLVENGIQIEDVALVEPASAPDSSLPGNPWLRRVRQMVRGDWVEFIDAADASGRDGSEESDGCEGTSGVARRERLTWLSPQRTVYIFSNHATNCAISITPEALAHRLQNATARLVEHETPLFERALDGAIKVLDQAAQE